MTDLKPTDIRYDAQGVYVRDQFIPSDNPRLAFAKQLAEIPDDGMMYGREGSWFHSRVMCDWRTIKWGLNCVVGGTGFGYERDSAGLLWPIPHHGWVCLEPGVELGNCVCIDRGVIGATVIGEGTKIDNLCHIAHGVKIGKFNTIAAHCSIEGSVEIGDYNTFGSGVIVQRKVKVGSNCVFGSGSVVVKDVEDFSVIVGNPGRLLRKTI